MSLNMPQIENDFQYALERQEFALHYQPKVNLKSGAIAGVEALIRWRHPRCGLLEPRKFIPLAETCGAILPIGWIMRIFGKDFLRLARDRSASTYWQPRSDERLPGESMRQQF